MSGTGGAGDGPMGVAIVGAGRMGEVHAEAWAALAPEAEVVAVVDPGMPRALAAAPGARVTTDLDAVLADPGVGIVSICTPTDTHLDLTARVLAAGRSVLLEKPLARTVEEGERLVRLARDAVGILMVAHVVRFFPGYRAVRELVAEGALGVLREVHAARLSASGGRPAWTDDERRSGGLLLELAVHDLDQLLLLLGPARRVQAVPAEEGTVEVTVEHASGTTGHVLAGWDLPPEPVFQTRLEVRGDRGSAGYRFVSGGPVTSEIEAVIGGVAQSMVVDPGRPYALQARHLLDHVRAGTDPEEGDPAAALAAIRLALAARESLAHGGVAVDVEA